MDKTIFLRVNQAGYKPNREKKALVLSDNDIAGAAWRIAKNNMTLLNGVLETGGKGDDVHVAQACWYTIDFSPLNEVGAYTLELAGADTQRIIIDDDPYGKFAAQALQHLRTMRSGCPTPLTNAAHLGDSAAIAYTVDGDWENGAWKEQSPRRTIDMRGGHYDAGDCIKFTLTIASLAWHLLRAYEENAAMFTRECKALPDILDEAKYALDYLVKTFPDENTFVIQVGDGRDHDQGWRLPENDALDGKRPALCALSRTHMGATAAALALGAALFKEYDAQAAEMYAEKAVAIYQRARKSDTQASAFERNVTNDFYYDRTDADNMALAAAELYGLTKDEAYLKEAAEYAPPPAGSVSWSTLNAYANFRLTQHGDSAAKERFLQEVTQYKWDNPWDLPGGRYSWGSLPVWMGMANNYQLMRKYFDGAASCVPFLGVLDYTFGRNNWGIGMIASDDLPYTVRNIYSFVTNVLGKLATGAMSEGPGNKATHDKFKHYFKTPAENPFDRFNTAAAVFYDDSYDFMIAESTIWGQGNLLLMLALG